MIKCFYIRGHSEWANTRPLMAAKWNALRRSIHCRRRDSEVLEHVDLCIAPLEKPLSLPARSPCMPPDILGVRAIQRKKKVRSHCKMRDSERRSWPQEKPKTIAEKECFITNQLVRVRYTNGAFFAGRPCATEAI